MYKPNNVVFSLWIFTSTNEICCIFSMIYCYEPLHCWSNSSMGISLSSEAPRGNRNKKEWKIHFSKKNLFFVRFEDGRSFWRLREWELSQVMWIFEEKVFFARFCIDNAARQNEDILGSNNRIETCDTAMKSVDDKFLKQKYLTTIRIFYQSRKRPESHLWVN